MRTVQDITFGVTGQTLVFDAPEGRPTSVTSVTVYQWDESEQDDVSEEPTAAGTGSVETNPDTTLDVASGSDQADPTLISVAATTGFVAGRSYLITGADGRREWFDCVAIDSGVAVTSKHPLVNAYAVSDTVQSTRIQATVDSTWVADDENLDDDAGPNPAYRVRWEYVVGGQTHVADTYFNLVRYKGAHGVQPQDVDALYPGWIDRLPVDHIGDQGRRLIDEAYRAVKLDLHAALIDDASVAQAEVIDDLTRWKAIELGELARFMANGTTQAQYEVARQNYRERLDTMARITLKVPLRDKDGAATMRAASSITRR